VSPLDGVNRAIVGGQSASVSALQLFCFAKTWMAGTKPGHDEFGLRPTRSPPPKSAAALALGSELLAVAFEIRRLGVQRALN
jgi:hypothetical protein